MTYRITLIVADGKPDYTFFATDEEVELNWQDTLVRACEEANIDTQAVINVLTEHEPDEEEEEDEGIREETECQFREGDQFVLSENALDNYGEQYRGQVFTIEYVADHSVPSKEYFDPASPRYHEPGGHPGFDEGLGGGQCLYGSDFPSDLYDWEMEPVLPHEEGKE